MTRQDFIFTLFDNGNGLSLEQIERAEAYARDDAACQTFDEQEVIELIPMAREVFINGMSDCADMIELRDYLNSRLYGANDTERVSDMQVYRLWYVTRGGID